MFSRKKKEDKKRKHKPGMTQDEINQLQEVGMRRGFWGVRKPSTKRDKKPEISGPINVMHSQGDGYNEGDMISISSSQGSPQLHQRSTSSRNSNQNGSHDDDFKRQSVKEKAAMYGGVVSHGQSPAQPQPMPVPASRIVKSKKTDSNPIPPVRKKSWKNSKQPENATKPDHPPKPRIMPKPHGISHHQPQQQAEDFHPTATKVVVLRKRQGGDFGFSLRRSSVAEQLSNYPNAPKKTIYFAEPGPHQNDGEMPLHPGDRLIEIDGWKVDNRNRDEVVARIKHASNSVKLLVSPAPTIPESHPPPLHHANIPANETPSQPHNVVHKDVWQVRAMPNQQVMQTKVDGLHKTPISTELDGDSERPKSVVGGRKKTSVGRIARGSSKPDLHERKMSDVKKPDLKREDSNEAVRPVTANELHASSIPSQTVEAIKPVVKEECNVIIPETVVLKKEVTSSVNVVEDDLKQKPVTNATNVSPTNGTRKKKKRSKVVRKKTSPKPPVENEEPKINTATDQTVTESTTKVVEKELKDEEEVATVGDSSSVPVEEEDVSEKSSSNLSGGNEEAEKVADEVKECDNQLPSLLSETLPPDTVPKLAEVQNPEVKKEAVIIVAQEPKVETPPPVKDVVDSPVFNEDDWEEDEAVWFIQDTGFCAAHKLINKKGENLLKDGQERIKIDHSGEKHVVSEEALENINPASLDRTEDLLGLRHLNESGILHTMRQRFNGNLQYTYAGAYLLAVCSPQKPTQHSDKVIQMFKGCRRSDMPPHIFSAAQVAFKELINTKTDQSLVIMGRSGSGKSHNIRHVLSYFVKVAGSDSGHVTVDKLHSAANVLESLSNAGTSYCSSATRCVHMYSIDINKSAQITGASVQGMLLEKSRVSRRPQGEENFKVFYQLLEGASDSLKRELFLVSDEQYGNDMISDPEQIRSESWRESARMGFKAMETAFDVLKFSADEIKTIYHVIAACMHLGMAGASKVAGNKYQFAHPDAAQKASSLLGISIENLSKTIFPSSSHNLSPSMSPSTPRHATSDSIGLDNLNAFIVGLYNEVFRITVSLINRELTTNLRAQNSLLVIDVPGVQYTNGRDLDDLVYNYTQERLQLIFNHEAFTRIKDRYLQEDVSCEMESQGGDAEQVAMAIDMPPSQQRSGKNLANDKKGLMWLLDEEAMINGASEESFIERLLMFFGQTNNKNEPATISRSTMKNHFKINHFKGACSIEYNASNWLKLSRENQTEKVAIETLQDSKKKYISAAFGGKVSGGLMQGSVVGLEGGGLMLRRAASMRKAWSGTGAANVKKRSLPLIKKLQVDSLIDAIRRTNAHFIVCAKPYELTDVSSDRVVDVKGLREQLRCYQLLDATRVIKQGYVEHCVFSEFRQKFEVICRQMGLNGESQSPQTSTGKLLSTMDDKEATEAILQEAGLSKSQYKIGVSQVLLRYGTIANLEDRRNEKVQNIISVFQAHCRGYLARKLIEKRKIQTVAVRCIQRNVRKFIEVREWPWWRLLNKVLPLVTVRQTEEELREKEAELEIISSRFNKVSSERDELKQINAKYEAQILEMTTDLADEKATATSTTEMLEQETVDRMRLEKELTELQSLYSSLKQRFDVMEVELAEQKLLHSADNEVDSSDEEMDASEYKMKYEREKREAKFQMKKTAQEYEEKLDMLEQDKKHVERKVHQMEDEVAENERVANLQKKKAQRLLQELNDAKIHLEEMNSKNHELEKKQRKFDSELYSVQADLTEAKSAKDKLQREKEKYSVEVYEQEQTIRDKTETIEILENKLKNLEEELEETTLRDSEDGQMLNSLKKQKRELEAKTKDQEEELDEQAGQIQMLQQSKERLEMNNERQRQQHSREIDAKDEELEEMRQSYHKKIKLLETQVEEEEEDRSKMTKVKRDLEAQIQRLQDQQPSKQRDAESERRLRKDLKRYKTLLADAQTMIDHLKTDAVNKQQLRQLKAKLEESEYNCSIAVKGKKAIEIELEDIQAQLDEMSKAKQECEEKISYLSRENHEMQSRMEEDEDDNKELARKYRQLVIQQSDDKKTLVELNSQLDDLKRDKEISHEKIQSLQNQLQYMEENTTDKSNMTRLETKSRDLEMKLDFEKTTTRRLEVQLTRTKEQVEKQKMEMESLTTTEQRERDQVKRLQKQIRDTQEEQAELVKKEQDALQRKHELELQLEDSNNQNESLQSDLKLAFKRISDLQAAFEDLEDSDLDDYSDYSDNSESDDDEEYSASGWRSRAGLRTISTSSYRSSVDGESLSRNRRKYSFDDSDDNEPKSKTPEISDV